MVPVRHVKLTLRRAKNVKACTGLFSGFKGRTIVHAKASYKNLLYITNRVEDMGLNPEWEEDGTSVFHFEFGDSTEFITLELFNRTNDLIGVSKLSFSALEHLPLGRSENMTLPVMITPVKHFGEMILQAEILGHQAMGERGLLTVEIRKGQLKKIISFLSKTAKIKAVLTYKHARFTSGVLENVGNRFIWQENNVFTFMINSNVKPELDKLKIEIYNGNTKAGEGEIVMSSFLEENNLQGVANEFVTHTTDLSQSNKSGVVGNIEVRASFISKPVSVFSSPQHSGQHIGIPTTQLHLHPDVHNPFPTQQHIFNPDVHVNPGPRNALPKTQCNFYPDVHVNAERQYIQDPCYKASAPVMDVSLDPDSAWGGPAPPPARQQWDEAPAAGAPSAGAPAPRFQQFTDDEEIMNFTSCFH